MDDSEPMDAPALLAALRELPTEELAQTFRELDTLHHSTAAHRLLVLAVLDERGIGHDDGMLDTVGWVTWTARLTQQRARVLVEAARALPDRPEIADRRARGSALRRAARSGRAGRHPRERRRMGRRRAGLDRHLTARRGPQPPGGHPRRSGRTRPPPRAHLPMGPQTRRAPLAWPHPRYRRRPRRRRARRRRRPVRARRRRRLGPPPRAMRRRARRRPQPRARRRIRGVTRHDRRARTRHRAARGLDRARRAPRRRRRRHHDRQRHRTQARLRLQGASPRRRRQVRADQPRAPHPHRPRPPLPAPQGTRPALPGPRLHPHPRPARPPPRPLDRRRPHRPRQPRSCSAAATTPCSTNTAGPSAPNPTHSSSSTPTGDPSPPADHPHSTRQLRDRLLVTTT